jgi:hypothetical protein
MGIGGVMIENTIKLPNIDYENKRNLETMLEDLAVEYELHRTSYTEQMFNELVKDLQNRILFADPCFCEACDNAFNDNESMLIDGHKLCNEHWEEYILQHRSMTEAVKLVKDAYLMTEKEALEVLSTAYERPAH